MNRTLIGFFLIVTNYLGAQSFDSLYHHAYYHVEVSGSLDSAESLANALLPLVSTPQNSAKREILLGEIAIRKGEYLDAIGHYKQVIINPAIGEIDILSYYAHDGLGIVNKQIGDYQKSLKHYRVALRGYEELEPSRVVDIKSRIGSVMERIGNYDQAEDIYVELIEHYSISQDSMKLASAYNKLGILCYRKSQFEEALISYLKAYDFNPDFASYLHNIGDVYIKLEQFDSAIWYLNRSLDIKLQKHQTRSTASNYINLGRAYLRSGDFQKVPENLKKGEEIALQYSYLEKLKEAYEVWVAYYDAVADYQNKSEALEQLLVLNDSLLNVEKIRSINDLEIKYESEKKEEQLQASLAREEVNQQSILVQRLTIIGLLIIALLLIIVGLLVYRLYRANKREKDNVLLRMREQHHRIENNITVLASILSLAAKNTSNEEARALAEEGENRLNAMNLLHKELYWDDQKISIQFASYVENLCHYLSGVYANPRKGLVPVHTQLEDLKVDVNQTIPLSLILNELLTNAFKYGMLSDHPAIEVSLGQEGESIFLKVSDNGPGIMETQKDEPSFGMNLIETLVDQLRGKMTTESSESGTSISIYAPMKLA
ncbi:MAG: tetratricopeptide repeat protein [Cytophagales bacterium]|nr:tetratricopeptide repeat protein [Cytophagales bacterium]